MIPLFVYGQAEDNAGTKSTFSFTNPQVGQFIRFYLAWACEGEQIRPDDKQLLDSLSDIIFLDTNLAWEIGYHTDCRASKKYNEYLSEGHAKDIWDYLIETGVDSTRLMHKGYGETMLLNHCSCEPLEPGGYMVGPGLNCTEAEHQENRRAELRLVKILNSVYSVSGFEDSLNIIKNTVNFKNPKIGQLVRFRVYFELDSEELRPESYSTLDSILKIIQKDSTLIWEIGTHTDCRASMEYSTRLGESRARQISEYLISKGADSARLTQHSYGETMLLNQCACEPSFMGPGADCTEEEHQVNRRTELKLIRILNGSHRK